MMGYILLSTVAKERKYAQEYLGLLARRGDIGSIRIGKRWYTTAEWFSEFLRDADARKVEIKNAETKIKLAEKKAAKEEIKIKKVFLPEKIELRREKADEKKLEIEEKLIPLKSVTAPPVKERKFETVDLRMIGARKFPVLQKSPAEKISGADKKIEKYAWQNTTGQEKMIREWKIRSGGSSPNFNESSVQIPLFQKFAFSMAVVLILVLLFEVGLVYKNELKRIARLDSRLDSAKQAARLAGIESGVVAGAESTKLNLAVVKNSSLGYLGNQGDKIKENISLSRVLIRAAMEKSANSEQ